jgi:hypothetical protein
MAEWRGYIKLINSRQESQLCETNKIWGYAQQLQSTIYYIKIWAARIGPMSCIMFDMEGLVLPNRLQNIPNLMATERLPEDFWPGQVLQLITPFIQTRSREKLPVLLGITSDGRLVMNNDTIEHMIDAKYSWSVNYLSAIH